jgi:hypothetical protein
MAEAPEHRTVGASAMPPQLASTRKIQSDMIKDVGKWHLFGRI